MSAVAQPVLLQDLTITFVPLVDKLICPTTYELELVTALFEVEYGFLSFRAATAPVTALELVAGHD